MVPLRFQISHRRPDNFFCNSAALSFLFCRGWNRGRATEAAGKKKKKKQKKERPFLQVVEAEEGGVQRWIATYQVPKVDDKLIMEDDCNGFYVVRKGDVVGIMKNLSDCQAQVGSVTDPPVSVFKGYSLPRQSEEFLASYGLKNAAYVINAAHVKEDLFGALVPIHFQELMGSTSAQMDQIKRNVKFEDSIEYRQAASKCVSCILEFDGASKGNPGIAGAGVILRTEDGTAVWRLREGLGVVTCNVAEYRALILGLKYALKKGFKRIHVQGDSNLVCMQMKGLWKTKHQNMIDLWKQAKALKDEFQSFTISHVDREFNSAADAQANLAVILRNGEVREDFEN